MVERDIQSYRSGAPYSSVNLHEHYGILNGTKGVQ